MTVLLSLENVESAQDLIDNHGGHFTSYRLNNPECVHLVDRYIESFKLMRKRNLGNVANALWNELMINLINCLKQYDFALVELPNVYGAKELLKATINLENAKQSVERFGTCTYEDYTSEKDNKK